MAQWDGTPYILGTTALDGKFMPISTSPVDAVLRGADPTGATDSTAAIQAAVDYAIANAIGAVYIPSGTYKIVGTITVPAPLTIFGVYAPATSTVSQFTRIGGTVLVAGAGGTAGTPLINFTGATFSYGLRLSDLMFLGSNHFNTVTGAVDRIAIKATNIQTEVSINRVNITGFLRQGILFEGVFDGHITNSRIMKCGTAGTYPALDFVDATSNCNALHVIANHLEGNPYTLRLGGSSRHNQFVANKFELFSVGPASSSVVINGNAFENVFIGNHFVQRNADDTAYYANDTIQPAMVQITAGTTAITTFTANMFTTQPYAPPGNDMGSRWMNHASGSRLIMTSNEFNNVYSTGVKGIILGDDAIFTDNVVMSRAKSNTRNVMQLASRCLVKDNTIRALDTDAITTASALFTVTGTDNTIYDNKVAGVTYYAHTTPTDGQDFGPDARTGAPAVTNQWWCAGPSTIGSSIFGEANERASLFTVARPCFVDKLGVSVTVVGTAGAVIRLGIRADDGSGARPGTLLVDAGTVIGTAAATAEATFTPFAMLPGVRYWLTATIQGAAGTRPTLRDNRTSTPLGGVGGTTSAIVLDNAVVGMTGSSTVSGALPSTNASWQSTSTVPRIAVHVAS